ncbi:PAS domain S-box protein [Brevundimonas sp. GCM10030266]|uniref:PAS domain S-box protein n=1 Tax=Brevundimonas sp. GCM10030266 TaxID=3273386 RepID=UPI00361397D3
MLQADGVKDWQASMHPFHSQTEDLLRTALTEAERGEAELHSALEALPAPIYMTDPSGVVTFFNTACIAFTGRRPEVGKDRWCVTWKLYTEDGEFLPHDKCPMAVALTSGRSVRGITAIAERPDGSRVAFTPFPTPLLDSAGTMIGAVNLLLDVTDIRQIAELRSQARRAARLARGVNDPLTLGALNTMADEYEFKAAQLERKLSRIFA